MLVFKNAGLIDETALTVSGISAKEGDNPIGQFGTGMKYVIAGVLRLGGKLVVYRGKKKLEFASVVTNVRGKDFSVVTMNGRKLGFTDQLGKNWQAWMLYRELWSNMQDEKGEVYWTENGMDSVEGSSKNTTILISCPVIEQAHAERATIVLNSAPLYKGSRLEVHAGESEYVFYRGIRVAKLKKASAYTYNLTTTMQLTEDRTLTHMFMFDHFLLETILTCTSESFLLHILSQKRISEHFEFAIDYTASSSHSPSVTFVNVADQLYTAGELVEPARKLFRKYRDEHMPLASPFLVNPNTLAEAKLKTALAQIQFLNLGVVRDEILVKSTLRTTGNFVIDTNTHKIVLHSGLLLQSPEAIALVLVQAVARKQSGSEAQNLAFRLLHGRWPDRDREDAMVFTNTASDDDGEDMPF